MRARALAVCVVVTLAAIVGPLVVRETVLAAPAQASAASQQHEPQTCVQQIACGGGATLAVAAMAFVAVLGGRTGVATPVTARRIDRRPAAPIVDRLAAGRLFRPPRNSF